MKSPIESSEHPIILMADDEPTTLEVIEMFLCAAGYEQLVRTGDARTVLELVEEKQPDLVLLNLMMPHMNGLEVLQAIRSGRPETRDVPVIIVTGSSDPTAKQRAVEHGATDFLAKPIDPVELSLRVGNTLAASGRPGIPQAPRKSAPQPEPQPVPASTPGSPLVSTLVGDDERSHAIVASFVGRLRDKLATMDACAEAGRFEELIDLAHWLKGAAGTVGFTEFTDPAESLQRLAREHKERPVAAAIEALWGLADRIVIDHGGEG